MAKREGAHVLFLSDMSWPQLLSQIQIWTETHNQHPRISLPTPEDGMLFSYVITYTYTEGHRSSLSCTGPARGMLVSYWRNYSMAPPTPCNMTTAD